MGPAVAQLLSEREFECQFAYLKSHGQSPLNAIIAERCTESKPGADHVEDDIVEDNDDRKLATSRATAGLSLVDTTSTANDTWRESGKRFLLNYPCTDHCRRR